MALTNDEKVQALQDATMRYFNNLTTLSAWVDFVNTVTKDKVKTFLMSALDQASNNCDSGSVTLADKATDYDNLSADIGNL